MKKNIFILLTFLLLTSTVYAESITLVWTPSISPDVTEYRVYQSLVPSIFATGSECNAILVIDNSEDCPTKAVISNLDTGYRYHFIVTAIDNTGNESEGSNEISITIGDDPNPQSSELSESITATVMSASLH